MVSRGKNFFWASYADLMTSLFFVMLILFILMIITLNDAIIDEKRKKEELKTIIKKADELNKAIEKLDSTYFQYIPEYKKHKLKVNVTFPTGIASMDKIPRKIKDDLIKAGNNLQAFVKEKTEKNPRIQYLLIIEGQASKDNFNFNYELSYQRALSLKKFWEEKGIKFEDKNCEVLICGSGDGKLSGTKLMRESKEILNQRFLIHIIPKPGKIGD